MATGLLGFDILRRYVESNQRRVALLGAFRGKAVKSEYRLASGGGTFSGPYFGLDQATDKLTLELFRLALRELYINMPDEESAAIFESMADKNVSVTAAIGCCSLTPLTQSSQDNHAP